MSLYDSKMKKIEKNKDDLAEEEKQADDQVEMLKDIFKDVNKSDRDDSKSDQQIPVNNFFNSPDD